MSVDVLASCDIKEDTPAAAIAKFEARLGKIPTMWLQGGGLPRPEVVYTYEKLLELKDHPVAKCWPPYLDAAYKNHRGVFDPARWHMDDRTWMKDAIVRGEVVSKGILEKGEVKQKDVERVRERPSSNLGDQIAGQADDAIILSPQRGSFLSGCQAAKDDLNLRPDPPVGAANNRRVGSGRILRTEKEEFVAAGRGDFVGAGRGEFGGAGREEFGGAGRGEFGGAGRGRGRGEREGMSENREPRDMKFGFRSEGAWGDRDNRPGDRDRPGGDRDRPSGDRRDKYGFRGGWGNEDHHRNNNRDNFSGNSRGNGRGDYNHHPHYHNQREPEWMHETVSITDVMVLKGFDDDKNNPKTSRPNSRQSNRSERSHHSSGPGGSAAVGRPPAGLPGHILHQLEQQQREQQQHQQTAKQQKPHPQAAPKKDKENASPIADMMKVDGEADALLAALKQQHQHQENSNNGGGSPRPTGGDGGFNFDQLFEGNLASLLGGGQGATPEEETVGPAVANNGGSEDKAPASQSRFSKFFTKPRSRRSSIQDELVGFIMREINGEPVIKIPSPEESNKYFTPISPAAKTEGNTILEMLQKGHQQPPQQPPHQQQAPNPRQMLQQHLHHQLGLQQQAHQLEHQLQGLPPHQLEQLSRAQRQQLQLMQQHHQLQQHQEQAARRHDETMVQKLENGLKKSLGLDGGMTRAPQPPPQHIHHQQQPPALGRPAHHAPPPSNQHHPTHHSQPKVGDMSAFNKLVAQVKHSSERTPPPSAPMNAPVVQPNGGGGPPRPVAANAGGGHMVTELELLEQHQGSRMHPQQHPAAAAAARIHQAIPPQLLMFLDQFPLNPEVLKRPEAETLMMGLNSGTVPLETLVHQLSNPNLQNRQRETFLTVLKLRLTGYNTPAGAGGLMAPQMVPRTSPLPTGEHLLAQPPPMPAHSRVSPLMFAGMGATNHLAVSPTPGPQRVPSPQEMTKLTQQILQQALIKKKLEEQRENYRKKQEDDPLRKTENAGSPLLAFTPTSVMRKTAAERKDSDPNPKPQVVPELKISAGGQPAQEEMKGGSLSPGRAIKGKGLDRPSSLEVNGMGRAISALPSRPGGGAPPPGIAMPPMAGLPVHQQGHQGMPGLPPNLSMLLANQATLQQNTLLGFPNNAPNPLNALLASAGAPRFPPHHPHHHQTMPPPPPQGGPLHGLGLHLGPPSPRHHPHHGQGHHYGVGQATSPVQAPGNSSLSRFFTSDVLAAAGANSGKSMKLPPLPTGQALTLEEIERQQSAAATVKI